ncbi:MAG: ATP-binding protein [Calditrichia bacterium]
MQEKEDQSFHETLLLPLESRVELLALERANQIMMKMGDVRDNEEWQTEVRTALIEAVINAVEHSGSKSGKVEIFFEVDADKLRIIVKDAGHGFDTAAVKPVDFREKRRRRETRGWGLHLIREAMDTLNIESGPQGTLLKMVKFRKGKE